RAAARGARGLAAARGHRQAHRAQPARIRAGASADRRDAMTPAALATVSREIPADHPAFAGHFPGAPLLPGAALLAEVIEAALSLPTLAQHLGPSPGVASAKFLA